MKTKDTEALGRQR